MNQDTELLVMREPKIESLKRLQIEAHDYAIEKGFWEPVDGKDPTVLEKLMMVTTEIAEAAEEYRKHKALDEIYYVDGKPEGFPIELADAVIRVADLAERYNVDLDSAIRLKMDYNQTRPHMHGGKKYG